MRFAERVYAIVRAIPRGRVLTYGDIAALVDRPRGAREVGWALAACRDPRLPAHRVVDRSGRLAPHFVQQRLRLEDEGVRFDGSGHVVLAAHRWRRPSRGLEVGRQGLPDRDAQPLRDVQKALHRRQRASALDHADESRGESGIGDARLRHASLLAEATDVLTDPLSRVVVDTRTASASRTSRSRHRS
ncbi:MAG TPA: MGMT family protein [Candidatus Dormibacteraeota bacterium]|jgi:methylated-DNA-protein-cysteine methyltransferase-like protein|nr:MGMT family protein [Candidatus Dormibacteraeota bacterium]